MYRRRRHVARGLTLLEVVIAVSLIAMLMGAMMTFFLQTMRAREAAAEELTRTQVAR
ncbi:MAG: type II secretion system protein, partial [Phycisphaerae bacterium]|nr:type II secretion system protein [Phycisphaerae bacterium]